MGPQEDKEYPELCIMSWREADVNKKTRYQCQEVWQSRRLTKRQFEGINDKAVMENTDGVTEQTLLAAQGRSRNHHEGYLDEGSSKAGRQAAYHHRRVLGRSIRCSVDYIPTHS
ncbi:hypothetical protein G6F42_008668 [Rhizopus arrhizus]|nr:hypothetical protein G6F42_008668 [Rhizopus arrhizus]